MHMVYFYTLGKRPTTTTLNKQQAIPMDTHIRNINIS
jgi:hypothetical protein